jgi:hypothetical protein
MFDGTPAEKFFKHMCQAAEETVIGWVEGLNEFTIEGLCTGLADMPASYISQFSLSPKVKERLLNPDEYPMIKMNFLNFCYATIAWHNTNNSNEYDDFTNRMEELMAVYETDKYPKYKA